MSEIRITRPPFPSLFGGLGFHNSEWHFYRLTEKEHFDQKLAKCYREISPAFMRTFGGFSDWSKESMDTFADYYERMQKVTDTPIYLAAAMGKQHFSDEERWEYAQKVAEKLDYLINVRNVKQIRYYCFSNELSCGNHGVLRKNLDLLKKYHEYLYRAFQNRELYVGLLSTDESATPPWTTIDYAIKEMASITEDFCTHLYVSTHDIYNLDFYEWFRNQCLDCVMKCIRCNGAAGKRLIIGEFGFNSGGWGSKDVENCSYVYLPGVIKDVTNFNYTGQGAYAALAYTEGALAAINAGVLNLVYWTYSDYPDPYVCHYAENDDYAREWGKNERYISQTQDTKYNKCGLMKWEDDGDYSVREMYWALGLVTKYMKRNSKVLNIENDDPMLRMAALLHKDGNVSMTIVNRAKEKKTIRIKLDIKHAEKLQPFKVYEYDSANVPMNEFGDLQDESARISLDSDLYLEYELLPESITVLTTDYIDRPDVYADGVRLSADGKTLMWNEVKDKLHCYYRVYRGESTDFIPSKENQIASTIATTLSFDARYLDEAAIMNVKGDYYKVISVNKKK